MKVVGRPTSFVLEHADGTPLPPSAPVSLVRSAAWTGWPDEDIEDQDPDDIEDYSFDDIRILDLGEAFLQTDVPTHLFETPGLRAPEIVFAGSFDYRIDLWRVGLIVGAKNGPCR